MGCDEWETVGSDTRENYYEEAWKFWRENALLNDIGYAYNYIKELIAVAGEEAESDDDSDD